MGLAGKTRTVNRNTPKTKPQHKTTKRAEVYTISAAKKTKHTHQTLVGVTWHDRGLAASPDQLRHRGHTKRPDIHHAKKQQKRPNIKKEGRSEQTKHPDTAPQTKTKTKIYQTTPGASSVGWGGVYSFNA